MRSGHARTGVALPGRVGTPLVLFDVGGVLIHWDDELAFRRVAQRYALDPVRTSEVLTGLRRDLQRGRLTLHQFWSEFARRFSQPTPPDWRTLWARELARAARPRRDVLALAAELRGHRVRTGVFSNTDASHWRFFRSSGWFDGLSPMIASFQLGAVKPDLVAFRRAAGRLPAGAALPVFVDDRPPNVRAARQIGWDALPFTTVRALRDELKTRGLLDDRSASRRSGRPGPL
jgi:putative hydrolase of the HAD superfamily